MLLGVTNKKQVLIDLGIDDSGEADDAADDNIAGGETRGASHLCDIMTLSVTCHNLSQNYLWDKSGQIKVWFKVRLVWELIKFYQTQIITTNFVLIVLIFKLFWSWLCLIVFVSNIYLDPNLNDEKSRP